MESIKTDEESWFRASLRDWLSERQPFDVLPVNDDARIEYLSSWQKELFNAGWMCVSFPEKYGGRGLPMAYEAIVQEELGRAGAPSAFHYAYVARVLLDFGSPEQRERYIRPALRGDERWCQGFSEPDAGSDLAAIRTTAHRRENTFVISGQKVWSSRAHWSQWCLLLARTGPSDSRHRGLSVFIVPTDVRGLTIRPFRQMTGGLEFAELFLDDVEVPLESLVGALHGGWEIAMATVSYERGPSDVGTIADIQRRLHHVISRCAENVTNISPQILLDLARLDLDVQTLQSHIMRGLYRDEVNVIDSTSSVDKILVTDIVQRLGHLDMDVDKATTLSQEVNESSFEYLYGRAASVYGGSAQIQRNIIAQRILGLPRS
jgi:alkylation response protein AidB-like acyl-CoA dehydrogenase